MSMSRTILYAAVAASCSLVVVAQVIEQGQPIEDTECTFVADCPSVVTQWPGQAGGFCYYCTAPNKQKRCLEPSSIQDNECQNTLWGPSGGCGNKFTGTVGAPPNLPLCNGPYTAAGTCFRQLCFNLP